MSILIEGIGKDWVVTRRPGGGAPELSTFASLAEFQQVMQRLLVKAAKAPSPLPPPRPATRLPVAVVEEKKEEERIPAHLKPLPLDADCRACGACCAPTDQTSAHHVRLDPQDIAAIPTTFRDSFVTLNGDGNSYLATKMAGETKVCAALNGSVGGNCRCGIYKRRPMVCQLFEPGSLECLKARHAMGVGE